MTVTDAEIKTLVTYCETNLGDPTVWTTPDGYPNSLALCIIDSIYSTGSHYSSVVNVIERYKESGGENDGAQALTRSIKEAGGARKWATTIAHNLKPANTRPGAQLKAEIIEQAAGLMTELGIDTVPDLRSKVEDNPLDNDVMRKWKRLPSQSSGVTYNYLLILAGMPSVKPDRMILRFLAHALGEETELDGRRAVELITETAKTMNVDPRALDHIAWRAASGRELTD
ncbi:hypothetical protein [Brevibacterium aurantiacum]|uniref:Heme peroxidase n=1 Tax=Brevibacterium aurantiacum TaxID=273384 RepID=A0A2H1KLZ3_BREAU|nr:hypothetical protein [Brevibacterium aurantiacum]GEB24801.1 heme peroxidase [Brevibacterium aurantiacum]SMY00797.1 hypothetical protein BAUR9175_03636 [Brevibacterium aurantiacum]